MTIHHICIETLDYQKSLWFYTEVMGFELKKETKNFHDREYNSWLKLEEFFIELQTPKKNQKIDLGKSPITHICFFVENVEKILEKIKKKYNNFKLKNNEIIYDVEGEKLFKIIAPEGTIIEIRDTTLF